MTKLKKMTPQQEKALEEHCEYWLSVGLSTEPANREKTEEVITEFYKILNLTKPYFWWCDSPMTAQLIMNHLKKASKTDIRGGSLNVNLRNELRGKLLTKVDTAVKLNVGNKLRDNLGEYIWVNLENNHQDYIWENLQNNIYDKPGYVPTYFWGSLESYWISYFLFPKEHLGIQYPEKESDLLNLWAELAKSTFSWWPFENIVILSDRPKELYTDAQGRLHCETGPACSFRDGWGVYYWHGVKIPSDIIENRSSVTIERIQEESNVEVRRVMMEIYTPERFILDSGAIPIHADEIGTLYRIEMKYDEPLVLVSVINSTPEPDGSYKNYWLRVHPELRPLLSDGFGEPQEMTAKAAVASTFGLTASEYNPTIET